MNEIITGDALTVLKTLPDASVQMCVTSPPYFGLRDYGVAGQIGLESSPFEYIANLVAVFREVKRVLRNDGVFFLNLGDSYAAGNGVKTTGRNDENAEDLARRAKLYGTGRIKATTNPQQRTPTAINTGLPPKNLMMIPARVAIALQEDGWYLRSDIIWHKLNAMPESVTDRPTSAHEHIFLLAKSERYFYDADAIRDPLTYPDRTYGPSDTHKTLELTKTGNRTTGGLHDGRSTYTNPLGRNKRDVWTVASHPFPESHFATFPPKLIEPCILAGSRPGDIVLDCFCGAGTTPLVALQHHRQYIGIELNPEYVALAMKRIATVQPTMWEVSA